MVSVLAFISGVIRGGSPLTGPTESWAATKTGNTNGIAASNRFIGYSVFGSSSTVWKDVARGQTFTAVRPRGRVPSASFLPSPTDQILDAPRHESRPPVKP